MGLQLLEISGKITKIALKLSIFYYNSKKKILLKKTNNEKNPVHKALLAYKISNVSVH